ncbi:MAG: 2-oxo acid dehydrogenase subunit E2, partial [Solirubrobacterales bacterium]
MAESRATVPSFTLETTVDMTTAVALRAEMKETAPAGELVPSINDLVVKACAIALREQPAANGAWRDGRFERY